ncbi:SRPBCC family protein [Sulfurovum sp.]|uniref:SRPBCC family protein n=1 Tax=Sulfurovum sp. TaxID=1969726 RepID=UPI0025EDEC55|nr:SRPBCC family protein [Sulfurovum sp.]
MPSYHVERSISIHAPLQKVKDTLRDFKQWPKWSPWIIMEPDATLAYSDRQGQVGATYGWSGTLVGAGSMELMEVNDRHLTMQIVFVKPFRSTVSIGFDLDEEGEFAKVTWHMDGRLPFFMFWMTEKMKTYIGMDYERGLSMLKEYLETGAVASYVIIEGVVPMKEQHYVGIPNTCAIKELGEVMKKDFETLDAFMEEKGLSRERVPFSIYNTFDMLKKESNYIACIPLDEDVEIQEGWVRGTVEKRDALKTIHTGRYLHLGNAWSTAMRFSRLKKIRTTKMPVGYEYYPNNPYDTPEEELVTEVFLPLK